MTANHSHWLVVGAVSLVPGKVKSDIAVGSQVRDEVEAVVPPAFLEAAPFQRINLMLRYGKGSGEVEFLGVDGEWLEVALELEMSALARASRSELHRMFSDAVRKTLQAIAERYGLPTDEVDGLSFPGARHD